MRTRSALFGLLLLTARDAPSQAVRGVAIPRDSLFASGVIITLLDDKGTPVARALGDDEGHFTIRAPSAGTYRIEARRVGFRPTLDVPLELEEGKIRLHTLVLTGAPIELGAVRTVAEA